MKRHLAAGALLLACSAPALAQHPVAMPRAWEIGASYGRDMTAEESLWAVSVARNYGTWKGVLEYADGSHGGAGSRVTSLKAFGLAGNLGGLEFGVGLGGSYVDEAGASGVGMLLAAEAVLPVTTQFAVRFEVSRTWELSDLRTLPANVVQAGLLWRF
jgi:hypothetical protein